MTPTCSKNLQLELVQCVLLNTYPKQLPFIDTLEAARSVNILFSHQKGIFANFLSQLLISQGRSPEVCGRPVTVRVEGIQVDFWWALWDKWFLLLPIPCVNRSWKASKHCLCPRREVLARGGRVRAEVFFTQSAPSLSQDTVRKNPGLSGHVLCFWVTSLALFCIIGQQSDFQ